MGILISKDAGTALDLLKAIEVLHPQAGEYWRNAVARIVYDLDEAGEPAALRVIILMLREQWNRLEASGDPSGDTLGEALAKIRQATADAAAAVTAEPDPRAAYRLATSLAESLRAHSEAAADLRGVAALRVFGTGTMSYTILARKLGVSKTRAVQLVTRGRERRRQAPGGS